MKSRIERMAYRRVRIRKNIFGTPDRPRLSVFRSLKHISAQVIDDSTGKTLAAASSLDKNVKKDKGVNKANQVGELLGKRAVQKGVEKIVFDRGVWPYHGRIKALADGARNAGLKF